MTKELIINSAPEGTEIALLENKKLVELHTENPKAGYAVGDIYLGKIKKLMPGLNAAFVDVGFDKDAFLHYSDLSPYVKSLLKFTNIAQNGDRNFDFTKLKLEPEILKTGKITEVFNGKPNILVQVQKEPIASKGPRLTCEISLPGRYVVLTPFNNIVAVSRKIQSSAERKRLQKIVENIKPNNFGIIVRTAAENVQMADLHNDINSLVERWNLMQQNMKGAEAPQKIIGEQGKTNSMLRDLLNEDFQKVVVNDKSLFADTKNYIQQIAPNKKDIVTYINNGTDIFNQLGITKQVKASFGKTVNLPSGAYLVIEHTEALHVIDVNSGYKNVSNNQEQNALETNLEAAEEISRQLRLRDIGGIIVVDFIDMKLPENRKLLSDKMEEFMKPDRARHSILPISKFGLMQITRQRMKPEVKINTSEQCPSCSGSGVVNSMLVLEDEIGKNLQYLLTQGHKGLNLFTHPIIEAYLKKGFPSIRMKWALKHKQLIKIKGDANLPFTDFYFVDNSGEQIKI